VTRLTPILLPALPDIAKRLLAGGRAVAVDGNTLDPTLQAFLAGQARFGVHGLLVDDDVARSRTLIRESAIALSGHPTPVHTADLTIPGPAGPIAARHYQPVDTAVRPLLVYYHGGGFALGDLDGFDAICRRLCHDAGVHVLSIDYRLAPEHQAPAAVDDAFAAFRWAVEHAGDLGAEPGCVAVGGDSAGGLLAAVVAQLARDGGGPLPVLQLLIYPITDFTAQTRSRTLFSSGYLLTAHDIEFFTALYLGESGLSDDDVRVAPLRTELTGLPPALVITAGFDPLRDEGEAYAAALAAAGVPVDLRQMGSMIHAFINLGGLGGRVEAAIAELTSALKAYLRRG